MAAATDQETEEDQEELVVAVGTLDRREDKEIDQKEIQEKIRETQAKLSGGSRPRQKFKSKDRREKRQEMAEAMGDSDR